MVGSSSSFPFGIRKNAEMNTRTSSLKVSKDSHRIRKPSLPLPQVQYRPPIIIHTYSPTVIHTQPDDFMSLVQKLTGSSDTRLRLKRSNSTSKFTSTKSKDVQTNLASQDHHQVVADHQPDVNPAQGQAAKSTTLCGSPCSSEESNFLALEGSGDPNSLSMKQSDSPRGPLSNYEFDTDAMMSFSSLHAPSSAAHIFSHVKPEPSFPAVFNDMTSFNFFTSTSDVFSQSPSKCSSSSRSQPADHHHHHMINPFLHHIDINSPSLPSGFYSSSPDHHQLSPTLTSRLCGNSSSSQTMFLDPISSSAASSYMNLAAPIPRQRYAAGGYSSAPEAGTMVSLENIQAFMFS